MSFGFSPSDVVKLLEVSTRIYLAFKDANENSEAQVEALVREFKTFHHCLVQLDELMKEFGKPLPFPCGDFQETLQKCEKSIKPYAENLVDRRMNFTKMVYTIKYMGKEKEIDGLRKQITGHYQALQMCISFLQLRLHLEATKKTQRLLDSTPFRSMSLGGQWYTSNALGSSTYVAAPQALPAPSEADQLYKDWVVFSRWLKTEDDRVAQEASISRPLSLGDTPAAAPSGDAQTAAILYHLRRELEDAIIIEENRAKRTAVEKRTHLGPSDAVRREVQNLPQVPQRTYTLETDHSGNFSRFDPFQDLSESTATVRPDHITLSPTISEALDSNVNQSYFAPVSWAHSPRSPSQSVSTNRSPSISTFRSSISLSAGEQLAATNEGDNIQAGPTPEELMSSHSLRSKFSITSLATIALGEGALEWNKLCRKVQVERTTCSGVESRECDIHWRYREDAGISIRSVYRSGKEVKVWMTQKFPATGPSIPLSTSYPDGDVSIDFPRSSFGRLDKRCTNIKYTFTGHESSLKLQTLLYTNNSKDAGDLLFDRSILTISSNLNKPECRGKNLRLWRTSEEHEGIDGPRTVDVLMLLFYTSALPEEKGHWVEEPHYIFQWLSEDVCKKSSDKLSLSFSRDPGKWSRDKLFQRRKSSYSSTIGDLAGTIARRRDSTQLSPSHSVSPNTSSSSHPNVQMSIASSAASINTIHSDSDYGYDGSFSLKNAGAKSRVGNLNRFGYSELEIRFQNKGDRKDFVSVWQQYVKQLTAVK